MLSEPRLPSLALTIVITLFFGLFGLIPANVHSNRARRLGVVTNRYWKAFGWTLLASVVSGVLIYLAFAALLLGMLGSVTSGTGEAYGPASGGPTVVAQDPAGDGSSGLDDDGTGADTPSSTDPDTPTVVTIPSGGQECDTSVDGGDWAAAAAGNDHTSCPFSDAVRDAYDASGAEGSDAKVRAYSKVTHKWYSMSCTGGVPVECRGGNDALVLVYASDADVQTE